MMDNQWNWIFIYGCFVVTLFRISHIGVVSANQEVYSLCDDPDSHLVKIVSLELTPNPIVVPGTVDFSVTFNITEDIEGPISMDVSTSERQRDGSWRPYSCMDYGMRQCRYDDICNNVLDPDNNPCPSFLEAAGLFCSCPITAGVYSFKNLTAELFFLLSDQEMLINVNMTTANSTVICIDYDIFLTPYVYRPRT